MKRFACTIALIASNLAPAYVHAQTAQPVVTIENGELRGQIEDGVESWKGIPFAAPPVGRFRWRAPQPMADWQGVRDATAYASDCMQEPFPSDAAPLGTTPAEDCLYANVWKPADATGKLPVVVWIYGGGFVNGGASPPTYAGANMAKKGVLFFSFNYRVGRFGTFALPQMTGENLYDGRLGNFGTMDQIAALKWVQRNIAAFGGDPDNVTIIGESAGGMSVHQLVTSPLARGLFDKAVIMSGGTGRSDDVPSTEEVEAISANFARQHGIDPEADDAMDKLRALSAQDVTDGLNLATMSEPGPKTFSRPFVDGTVNVDMGAAYDSGDFAQVPMLIGATSADIGGRTGYMVAGARQASAAIADHGVPVWEYRFSYVAGSLDWDGAYHASDIPYFFDNAAIKYGDATTATDRAVGDRISDYLVNFAKTGDPNGAGLPQWPRYARDTDLLMDFNREGDAVAGPDPWGAEIDAAQ
ncbi:MAG: carboxylesterase [Sphingomonas sp.]|nr:carboxylesterase [Sphingomonas sp.]